MSRGEGWRVIEPSSATTERMPDPDQVIANQIAYLDHLYRRSQMGFQLEGELADRLESEIRKGLGI